MLFSNLSLARSLSLSALAFGTSLAAMACSAPASNEELEIVPQEGAEIVNAPERSDVETRFPGTTHCMGAMIPGVDDPEQFIRMCGGGGGTGGSRPQPAPLAPSCASVPEAQRTGPNVREKEMVCEEWVFKGVTSKDETFLRARARDNCLETFRAELRRLASEPNTNVVCADETEFGVRWTDTKKDDWTGKRSFKAGGVLKMRAIATTPFDVCTRPNPPPYCLVASIRVAPQFE